MTPGPARVALLVASALFGVSVAVAQTGGQPAPAPNFAHPPFRNLKVFPQTITRAQLLSNMKFFSQSLGVRCTFCHVGEEGKPLSTFDFASDAKEHKKTARFMLEMVHRINEKEFGVTDFSHVKVTCFTCHRGAQHPLTEPPPGAVLVPPPAKAPERGS